MKLYGSLTSPYVRKVRVLVKEKNLPVEYVPAAASGPDSPVPALNPLGRIPVLTLPDGDVLFDSPVIVEYLDALSDPWLPAPGTARWEMLRWQALADGILDDAVGRLLESRRPAPSAEAMGGAESRIASALVWAERRLAPGPYVQPGRFSIADIALGVALEYIDFRYPHDWRARHPRLTQWLAGVSTRPAFVETRPPKG